jgi:4-amino-4-deoxy-L-arabinose transferase-like glycosyltransferase
MMLSGKYWSLALAILVIAFALRVGLAVWWHGHLAQQGQRFAMGDSESYWFLAHTIAADEPYQYGSPDAAIFRTPVYPWFLSWFATPGERDSGLLAVRIAGCVLGTGAVALMMLAALWTSKPATSLFCGLLAAVYPGGVISSVLVLSEAPFMPLMVLNLLALLGCERARSEKRAFGWAILAGLLAGLGILTRPSWLLFLPFYFACKCLLQYRQPLPAIQQAIVAGIALALTMSPWWFRNYQLTGHFVLTTLQVGASLYDGFHPGATGGSDTGMAFSLEFGRQLRAEDAASPIPPGNFEYRLNQRLTSAALNWMIENPRRAFWLSGQKFLRTWWPWPAANDAPGGWTVRLIFACSTYAILIPGLWIVVRRPQVVIQLLPFILPLVYFTLLHSIFVGSIRYREPALFAFTLLAASFYVGPRPSTTTEPENQDPEQAPLSPY